MKGTIRGCHGDSKGSLAKAANRDSRSGRSCPSLARLYTLLLNSVGSWAVCSPSYNYDATANSYNPFALSLWRRNALWPRRNKRDAQKERPHHPSPPPSLLFEHLIFFSLKNKTGRIREKRGEKDSSRRSSIWKRIRNKKDPGKERKRKMANS